MIPLFRHLLPRPLTACPSSILCFVLVSALSILACEENAPTETRAASGSPEISASAGETHGLAPRDVSALAIALPVNQAVTTTAPAPAFRINQTGTGPNGIFAINNAGNSANALQGQTNGSGIGVRGVSTNATSRAGVFEITNSGNSNNALTASTNGSGNALSVGNTGTGPAGVFFRAGAGSSPTLAVGNSGSGPALQATATGTGSVARFNIPGTLGTGVAVDASTRGGGVAAFFHRDAGSAQGLVLRAQNSMPGGEVARFEIRSSVSQATALVANTPGTGWVAEFAGTTKGVRINTHGNGVGLQVVGGSKSAVVNTTAGARALYSEEATEVWFADYGFGKLVNGRARILIDPGFAQTVSLDEPYHVFVQPYGRAELYVQERTNLGFVVMLKDGDSSAEFGYRVLGKRRGFEGRRLERAPWADNDVGFDPDQ